MKLLYLPNESIEGDQYGPRLELSRLQQAKRIEELEIFSFLLECKRIGNWQSTLDALLTLIEQKKPTAILAQHIGHNKFPDRFFQKLNDLYKRKKPIVAYLEGDVYGYCRKRLPSAIKKFVKHCDIVFLVANGSFANRFRRFGCKNVVYVPNVVNFSHFGVSKKQDLFAEKKDFDVVFIGNHVRSHVPFISMPGVRQREELVNHLRNKYPTRFAIYGRGWEKSQQYKGVLPFLKQGEAMHKAWIRVGHNHFHYFNKYFSNSLPITLATGTPYVVNRINGLEDLLIDRVHCRMYDSIPEALQIIEELLAGPKEVLLEMGWNGIQLAKTRLSERWRMEQILAYLEEKVKNDEVYQ